MKSLFLTMTGEVCELGGEVVSLRPGVLLNQRRVAFSPLVQASRVAQTLCLLNAISRVDRDCWVDAVDARGHVVARLACNDELLMKMAAW
ncbi:hypothetical protein [uncultured Aquitalea sp.]|uniref:hypothetical protein n=2 Tax=uncultured Aquitalea sp. TaxID=540272 RepID=UPI0025F4804F|nr:hypothetical protein [uncultured Aquitalea sp.]